MKQNRQNIYFNLANKINDNLNSNENLQEFTSPGTCSVEYPVLLYVTLEFVTCN